MFLTGPSQVSWIGSVSLELTPILTPGSIGLIFPDYLRDPLAGNVGFLNVKKMVELADMCVLAQHVANMLADMSATQPKTVSAEVLTMSSHHVTYGYVSDMLAYVGSMLAAWNQVERV